MAQDSADPVVKEYAAAARGYDSKWSFYIEATTRETLARVTINPTDCVLDVGCGTGELLARIAAKFPAAKLAGLDPVQEMLDIAAGKLSPAVDLRRGYANGLPWPEASFDVVISCNVFHYVTHPVPALREMTRVLRPGGQLVITDWCDDYLACRLCNAYLRLTSNAHYRTYRQRECVDLLKRAGHPSHRIERYKISWLWGLMTASVLKPA